MNPSNSLFNVNMLDRWSTVASVDEWVKKYSILADLCIGLRSTDTEAYAWLTVRENNVNAGLGALDTDFGLKGDEDAFTALVRGMPFNRLVRQHRLVVTGNTRTCVQNWKLLYALMSSMARLEG